MLHHIVHSSGGCDGLSESSSFCEAEKKASFVRDARGSSSGAEVSELHM